MIICATPNRSLNPPKENARIPISIQHDNKLSTTARVVAHEISAYCHSNAGVCTATNQQLAKPIGVTPSTISRAIQELVSRGHIHVLCDRAFITHRSIVMTDAELNEYFDSLRNTPMQ